jgi:hypothetical protein
MCYTDPSITLPTNVADVSDPNPDGISCAQNDVLFESDWTLLTSTLDCSQYGPDYVISCFLFASIGATTGSCGQCGPFADDGAVGDRVGHLPDEVAATCLGQPNCTIWFSKDGYYLDAVSTSDPISFGLRNTDRGMAKGKFVAMCLPGDAEEGCDGIANSGLVDDVCGVCGGDGSSCDG